MTSPTLTPRQTRNFLGPVADLEHHLPEEWWRELFDSLYLQTDGDVVENDANTVNEVDLLIAATGIQPMDRILDLCCGQGRHSLELASRGFRKVTGVDRSGYLIRVARRRAKKMQLPVSFHERDARRIRFPERSFDAAIVMGNSFGYFERAEDDLKVLENIAKILRPGGSVILDLTDGDWMRSHFEARSWEWIDGNHFVCRERSLAADNQRLVSRELVSHAERGVIADRFYAERLYSADAITALLGDAGFHNVRVHGSVEAVSDRGQDLGMMAHRLFLSAQAPRRAAAATSRKRKLTRVAVLLGDPRLPDSVKRGGHFNNEDLDTVQRLKDALSEIDSFEFEYLDNHASLMGDLRTLDTDLVMNLCDEGWNNDAFAELHVPAMLETLGLPYTGAGPACLGMCYDKAVVSAVARGLDIPVPLESYFRADDQSATLPSVFPAILKPNFGDSSIGITSQAVVHSSQQLMEYLGRLRTELPNRPLLVQEFLPGTECSVSLVGNPGGTLRALPILEVDYSALDAKLPRILGYESKWLPDSPYWTQVKYRESSVEADVQRSLIDWSTLLFDRLRCRDYARFDFRADAYGDMKLLEVNPNPGWCWDGKLNLMASFTDISYAELLKLVLEAALERGFNGIRAPSESTPAAVASA
jgi:D-alanine-D-alanine ligase